MLPAATERILRELPEDATLLDVGGWAAPLNRATHVLDMQPFETRGLMGSYGPGPERFDASTWAIADICGVDPWPYADDQFDFAVCVTTLEDVRDPLRVCAELSRVAKAGYVEVPTVLSELMYWVQGPWLGYMHHRWLCDPDPESGGLLFRHKDHALHSDWRLRVVPRWHAEMSLDDLLFGVFWEGSIPAREVHDGFDRHDALVDELIGRVRARFRPSPANLRALELRAGARHAAGRIEVPVRRAAEKLLRR